MSRASRALIFCALGILPAAAPVADRAAAAPPIGRDVTPAELAKYFTIQPDGRGLPDGHGDVRTGEAVFQAKCAACHGKALEGVAATGGPALGGGRGTLRAVPPKKTVESYWPYATALFDYVKRAMPFNQPGSLSNDEVYALCAYILAHGKVVPDDAVMNKTSLAHVVMPNRDGFVPFDNAKVPMFR